MEDAKNAEARVSLAGLLERARRASVGDLVNYRATVAKSLEEAEGVVALCREALAGVDELLKERFTS